VESRASEKSTEPNPTLGIDQPTRTPRTHLGRTPSTKGDPTISAELPQRQLSPHGRRGRTTLTSQQRSSNWRRPILTRPPISRQTATTASASTGRSPRGPVRCAGRPRGDSPGCLHKSAAVPASTGNACCATKSGDSRRGYRRNSRSVSFASLCGPGVAVSWPPRTLMYLLVPPTTVSRVRFVQRWMPSALSWPPGKRNVAVS